ncbi:MAG: hypothetical protein WCH11_05905 [Bdellovibrio sp.]
MFFVSIYLGFVSLGVEAENQRAAQAGVDLSSCDKLVSEQLSKVGMDGAWSNSAFSVVNGRVVMQSNQIVSLKQKKSNDRESYHFKKQSGTSESKREKLEIVKSNETFTVRHIFDDDTDEKSSHSRERLADPSSFILKPIGQEVVYSSSGAEGCRVTQIGNIVKHSSGNFTHVWMDSEYCEAARNLFRKYQRDAIDNCSKILNGLQSLYVGRDDALKKEGKTLREPGSKAIGVSGIPDMLGGITAISSCSFSGSEIGKVGSQGSGSMTSASRPSSGVVLQPDKDLKDGQR